MDIQKILKVKEHAYCQKITPPRLKSFKGAIVGFDSEYDSKTKKLICFQLYGEKDSVLVATKGGSKLMPEMLFNEAAALIPEPVDEIMLVCYFSAAEIQFMPVKELGSDIREYARGFMDCTFNLPGGKTLYIFDLCRWFDGRSLKDAAASFGMKKLEFDRAHISRKSLEHPKFFDYAMNDAKLAYDITLTLREKFQSTCGVDIITAKTPAQAAALTFRNLYVKKNLFCDNNRVRFIAMLGTWGGRAEVFERGRIPGVIKEYDLKSAYPSAAISFGEMPMQKSWREVTTVNQAAKMKGGFARIHFSFPANVQFPCLPVFVKSALLYPLKGETVCTFDEILYAVELGAKIHIVEGYGFNTGTTILRDFLQWTLNERSKAEGAAKTMFKLLGNSIIGKFAQRISKVPLNEYMRLADEHDLLLDDLFTLTKDELFALGAKEHTSVGGIFYPEWNGLITGRTRAELALMLNTSEPVYCHTDSVWGRKEPQARRLKFELKMKGKCTIIRTRFAVLKGRQENHMAQHSVWSREAAEKLLARFNGKEIKLLYGKERPLRFREAVERKKPVGTWLKEKREADTRWDFKRMLLPGGKTRPWADVEEYWKAAFPNARKSVNDYLEKADTHEED